MQAVGLSREGKRTAEERPVLRHLRTAVRRPLGEPPRSAWVVSSTLRFGYKLSCSTERLCQPHAWGYPSPSLHPREFRLSGSGGMWPGERAGSAWPLASCVNPLLKSRHLQGPQRSHPKPWTEQQAFLHGWGQEFKTRAAPLHLQPAEAWGAVLPFASPRHTHREGLCPPPPSQVPALPSSLFLSGDEAVSSRHTRL